MTADVIGIRGRPPGLDAAAEVAGSVSGGVRGDDALEGASPGGCLISGRATCRAAVQAVA